MSPSAISRRGGSPSATGRTSSAVLTSDVVTPISGHSRPSRALSWGEEGRRSGPSSLAAAMYDPSGGGSTALWPIFVEAIWPRCPARPGPASTSGASATRRFGQAHNAKPADAPHHRVMKSRLSPLDASFLRLDQSAHVHVGWCSMLELPPGRESLDVELLRDRILARIHHAPRFRQRVAAMPLGEPASVDHADFDIGAHRGRRQWRSALRAAARRADRRLPVAAARPVPARLRLGILVVPRIKGRRAAIVGKVRPRWSTASPRWSWGCCCSIPPPSRTPPNPRSPGGHRHSRVRSDSPWTRSRTPRSSSSEPRAASRPSGSPRDARFGSRRR